MSRHGFMILFLVLCCPACELLYLPPATWVVFPVAEISDNSMDTPDTSRLIRGSESKLRQVSVAVLRNPNRDSWNSTVEDEVLDERPDENALLARFLKNQKIFKEVVLVDSISTAKQDFIITCSVDCIYTIELDGWMYVWNCLTLGIGSVLGWPHHDSDAFYVAESVVYDNRTKPPQLVTGTLVENYKEWYCDNIYWRPTFYGYAAMKPLFRQILYDFLARSGCLAG
jgi:hypothetical protein